MSSIALILFTIAAFFAVLQFAHISMVHAGARTGRLRKASVTMVPALIATLLTIGGILSR